MKKFLVIALAAVLVSPVFAQTTNTSTTSTTQSKKSNLLENFQLTLEMGSSTKRDANNDIKGNETYMNIEPGYRINKQSTIMAGTSYKRREAAGTLKDAEKANRDHLDTAYVKFLYKATRYKDNGIADVRLQVRAYSDQDDFFKRRYASDGNYQLRAYFGRPIAGKWSLNKYTSYVRYKNYFNNKYVSDFSRDYEMRLRLNPTYTVFRGMDLGVTATYNHIFKVNKLNDEENVKLDLSARYQKGSYAALIIAGVPYMDNVGGEGELKLNEDSGKNLEYSLTLTAYL